MNRPAATGGCESDSEISAVGQTVAKTEEDAINSDLFSFFSSLHQRQVSETAADLEADDTEVVHTSESIGLKQK